MFWEMMREAALRYGEQTDQKYKIQKQKQQRFFFTRALFFSTHSTEPNTIPCHTLSSHGKTRPQNNTPKIGG